MADLLYNGVWLDQIKTEYVHQDPVQDPSGTDFECTKVTIQVRGVFHEYWLGSGKATETLDPPHGLISLGRRGHTMPVSLANLRDKLLRPRGQLQFWIGSELVLESPQRDQSHTPMPCDVRGGPYPQDVSVTEIIGTRAAFVSFRIETFVSDCTHYILSNRWRLDADADEFGYATHTISGRAALRLDFLRRANLQADDFRKWLILPPDQFMRRERVRVTVSEDGSTIHYTVTDRNVNYGTGENSGIAEVSCQVTGGIDTPVKSIKELISRTGRMLSNWSDIKGNLSQILDINTASSKINAICRIRGSIATNRQRLLKLAGSLIQDRVGMARGRKLGIVSAYGTVDWSSKGPPWVEMRCEFAAPQLTLGKMFSDQTAGHFEWDPIMIGKGEPLNWSHLRPASQLPQGNNTRAWLVGRLVSQVLSGSRCQRPSDPPAVGQSGRSVVAANTTTPNGV